MKTTFTKLKMIAIVIAFGTFIASCNNDDDPGPLPAALSIDSGGVLVDQNNQTIYIFTKDVDGKNNCEGGCAAKWPIYFAENPTLGTGLEAVDFGTITLGDGSKQMTFHGWPLYYFSPNADGVLEPQGAFSGEGVGGIWFVAKEYDIMLADTQLVGHDGNNYTSDYQTGDGMTQLFVDKEGNSVYIFSKDFKDTNNFTNPDFSNDSAWPIFYREMKDVPSTSALTDFGEIDVHGEMQSTYKGWPLYYFGQDENRGDTKGISFPVAGIWPIANLATIIAMDPPAIITNGTLSDTNDF